jgi:hypothetical protein
MKLSCQCHAPVTLYAGERTLRHPLDRRLGGPQSQSGHRGYRTSSAFIKGPGLLGHLDNNYRLNNDCNRRGYVVEISSSHGGEYDVKSCLLGCTAGCTTGYVVVYFEVSLPRWRNGNVGATGPKVCGFKLAEGDRFLRAIQICSTTFLRRGSKAVDLMS